MSYFGVFMNKLCANRCVAFRTADQSDATFALSSVQKRTFHCVLLSLSFFRSVLVSRISSQPSRTHSLSSAHPSRPAPSALLCSILVTLTRTYVLYMYNVLCMFTRISSFNIFFAIAIVIPGNAIVTYSTEYSLVHYSASLRFISPTN